MTFEILGYVKLFLVLSACFQCSCIQVSIPEPQYEVAKGSDITLPCSFSPARPDYELFILKWEVVQDNKGTIVATFYSNLNRVDISPDYEGRASLDIDSSKLTSALHLTKVTMGDNGNFQCSVLIPGDDEGTSAATTFVLVLVPPSSPVCRIQGKAEYWQNITLTCVSEEGSPVPQYKWKTYSVENIPRAFPPKTTESKSLIYLHVHGPGKCSVFCCVAEDGALSLRNISREMSGFYVCTSANRIGSVSCNLTLAVMPGGSMSGATVGIIGGVVGAVLLLAIVIFCCYRQKKKKAKYTEAAPGEIEFHDRDDIEGSDGYQENKIPKNHDIDITEQTQHSEKTGLEKLNVDMESTAGSHRSHSNQDRLDNNRDHYRDDHRGSRDRLDDHRGSRDRLDDYRGSRDRLDDYRGSRDRLDDHRGSRDRLDDHRGSRDRLDDHRGSRDRLDDYRGSRDRLDDYRGSRDRLDDHRGSRDRLDDH
ncbi:hypothetical protein NQD34_015423, partial [Periophthalmus magnuspinnatus]